VNYFAGGSGDLGAVASTNAWIGWVTSTGSTGTTAKVRLWSDASNQIDMRNDANAQTLNVYGTWTDASNGEWLSVGHDGTDAFIDTTSNGTGTTGDLDFRADGTRVFYMTGGNTLKGNAGSSFGLRCTTNAGRTGPTVLPSQGDTNTGIGSGGADSISLVTGGQSAVYYREASAQVLQEVDVHVGLTADVGSAQGGLPLLSSYNQIGTVGTAGDSCTLPTATVGLKVTIMNTSATSLDVFPATSDALNGASANVAEALAGGASVTYLAYDATNWVSI
jgi:hypothetical protein